MTCRFPDPASRPRGGGKPGNWVSLALGSGQPGWETRKALLCLAPGAPVSRFPGLPAISGLLQCLARTAAKVVAHARYTVFQMAEVAVPRNLFGRILEMIEDLRPRPVARC
jgi:hypothetical protein